MVPREADPVALDFSQQQLELQLQHQQRHLEERLHLEQQLQLQLDERQPQRLTGSRHPSVRPDSATHPGGQYLPPARTAF
jgi:hypothetical protein